MKACGGWGSMLAQLVLNLGASWNGVVNFMPEALYSQEITPVPIE
jgi:hypothetical protein